MQVLSKQQHTLWATLAFGQYPSAIGRIAPWHLRPQPLSRRPTLKPRRWMRLFQQENPHAADLDRPWQREKCST